MFNVDTIATRKYSEYSFALKKEHLVVYWDLEKFSLKSVVMLEYRYITWSSDMDPKNEGN